MGLFDRLFGRKASAPAKPEMPGPAGPNPEGEQQPLFPFPLVSVRGQEAVEAWERLKAKGAGTFWPVTLGDQERVSLLSEEIEEPASPQDVVAAADSLTLGQILADRTAQDKEYFNSVGVGDWPSEDVAPGLLVGHTDILSSKPLKQVFICEVPTPNSWETPAYLQFGGWNECPVSEEQVALFRDWHGRYGADIVTIRGDILEARVDRRPTDREEALALAREQFIYCPDIVYQGTGDLSHLAATLMVSDYWYFWWD